jgi:hypothetical protein
LDCSSIKVVEGAVSETSALLEQKWDKIFYTGSCSFLCLYVHVMSNCKLFYRQKYMAVNQHKRNCVLIFLQFSEAI